MAAFSAITPDSQVLELDPITSDVEGEPLSYPTYEFVASGETEAGRLGEMKRWLDRVELEHVPFAPSTPIDQQFIEDLRDPNKLAEAGVSPVLAQAALAVISSGVQLDPTNILNVIKGKGLTGVPQNQAQHYITNFGLEPVKQSGGNTYFNTAAWKQATTAASSGLDPAQLFPDGPPDVAHEIGASTLFSLQGDPESYMHNWGSTFANVGTTIVAEIASGQTVKNAAKTAIKDVAFQTAGRWAGAKIGASVGGTAGGPVGAALGAAAGVAIGKMVGSSIICTELHRQGKISDTQRRIMTYYTLRNMTPTHFKGYYIWATPVVRQLKKGRLVGLFTFLINRWTNHILFKGGIRKKRDWTGQIIASVGESLTWAFGRAYELTEKRRIDHAHA